MVYPSIEKVLLFDLNADPNEMDDLADIPKYRDKVKTLFKNLIELQKKMNDTLDFQPMYYKNFSES